MRILVIGGTQFIGRAIVERIVARGDDVTVLHRRDRHDLGEAVGNIQADRADLRRMSDILGPGRYDAVIDVAYDWEKGTTPEQVESAARSCAEGLHRYIFMSSIAAYGPGLDLRETESLVEDDFPNPYAVHKAAAERALFRMHNATGFPVTTFRPPFVHGPRQPFYREQFFWDRLLDGRPIVLPDNGHAPMQWCSVSDLATACVRALDAPAAAGEAFNMAHVEPMTQRSFVEALARTAGTTATFVSVPRATILAAGGQLLMTNIYFGEYLDLPPHVSMVEKAPRVLGVAPTPFEAAIAETFAWYRTQLRRPIDYAFEDRLIALV